MQFPLMKWTLSFNNSTQSVKWARKVKSKQFFTNNFMQSSFQLTIKHQLWTNLLAVKLFSLDEPIIPVRSSATSPRAPCVKRTTCLPVVSVWSKTHANGWRLLDQTLTLYMLGVSDLWANEEVVQPSHDITRKKGRDENISFKCCCFFILNTLKCFELCGFHISHLIDFKGGRNKDVI